MQVKLQHPKAQLPQRSTPGAAGYDLCSCEDVVVRAGRRAVISTGLSVKLPPGVYGRVAPRSGLAVKNGIQVGAGVIDPDYQGEIKVVLFNHDNTNAFVVKAGYRVAQLILEKFETSEVKEVSSFDEVTKRSTSGFGSTGLSKPAKAPEPAKAKKSKKTIM